MRLHDFIRTHRTELDAAINHQRGRVPRTASCYCPKSGTDHQHESPPLNDEERRQWVLNDEGLYHWARSAGCKIVLLLLLLPAALQAQEAQARRVYTDKDAAPGTIMRTTVPASPRASPPVHTSTHRLQVDPQVLAGLQARQFVYYPVYDGPWGYSNRSALPASQNAPWLWPRHITYAHPYYRPYAYQAGLPLYPFTALTTFTRRPYDARTTRPRR